MYFGLGNKLETLLAPLISVEARSSLKRSRLCFVLFLCLGFCSNPAAAYPYTLTGAQLASVKEHIPFGPPSTEELLFREGYVTSHSNWLKIPNWSAYHISSTTLHGVQARSNDFRDDKDLKPWQSSKPSDYKSSGYDQGHMAPAGAMKRGKAAMSESFLLSNMVPQVGVGFNRGIWRILEDKVRAWAVARGEGWVYVGPVFQEADGTGMMQFKLIGKSRVAVPTHNFMILITRNRQGTLNTIAFMLPNAKARADQLASFIVSIHEIERLTGLDFLNQLPDEQEDALESHAESRLWAE